jgi:hypothetical protein
LSGEYGGIYRGISLSENTMVNTIVSRDIKDAWTSFLPSDLSAFWGKPLSIKMFLPSPI